MKFLRDFLLYPFVHTHILFALAAIACVKFHIGDKPFEAYVYLMLLAIYLKVGDKP